jgi:hypothetical protein
MLLGCGWVRSGMIVVIVVSLVIVVTVSVSINMWVDHLYDLN